MLTLSARERFTTPHKELLAFSPVGHEGIWQLPGLGIPHESPIYQRSNEQISLDAYQCIEQHPLFETSCISLNVEQGKVTIDGTVETPTLKEMLEQTLYHISGVSYVHNRLRLLPLDATE